MSLLPTIGLIPAAGQGARLNLPFPKELYPLPSNGAIGYVIENAIQNFAQAGLKKVVVVISPQKAEQIMQVLDSYKGMEFCYIVQKQNDGCLSTAIFSATPWIEAHRVFFQMPDTILRPNPFIKVNQEDLQFITFRTPQLYRFAKFNKATFEIVDKPSGETEGVSWGALVWSPAFTQFLASYWNDEKDFAKIMNAFGGTKTHLCELEAYYDLGTIGGVLDTQFNHVL